MIVFTCQVCQTQLSAGENQAGQLVRCPTCLTTLRTPTPAIAVAATALEGMASAAASASASSFPGSFGGGRPAGKRYGFNCGYCSSRLEATESMAAQEGQCPTCGNNIVIPILDRYGRLIDPRTRQIIKQDPHPVHAYAAAGDRAPLILRSDNGKQSIRCPRCSGISPITANNCKPCGMPFTMEGTTIEAAGSSNGFCVTALVLGILGLIPGCGALAAVLALIFGIIGLNQTRGGSERSGKGMAIAGIVCACIGGMINLMLFLN